MSKRGLTPERLAVISWALFLILVVSAIFIAAGSPFGPLTGIALVVAAVFATRFPYATLYAGVALTPFLGLMLSLPTGSMLIGQRAFGGSIDVSLGEVVMLLALLGWGLRLLLLWRNRRDEAWRPRLPMFLPSVGLAAAHLLSVFSPLAPDPLLVAKFSLRPVFYDYLAFVALPYNYIRSRKRLVAALGAFAIVSGFAALNGLVAMFFPTDPGMTIGRARPLAIFGVAALGDNQNELAELLVVAAPLTLALAWLMREERFTRLWTWLAGLQALVALLTFTRTAWIVLACEAAFLALGPFKRMARKHLSALSLIAVLLVPLGLVMTAYAVSNAAQSSTSTRLMLTEIALDLYKTSPIFGAGAGTFYDRVGSTQVFVTEYGAPLDSHGWLQKIAAETGSIGLLALGLFLLALFSRSRRGLSALATERARQCGALLIAAAGGGIIYQLFNTDYWTGKMWLPIGLALAGLVVLGHMEREMPSSHEGRPHDILKP